MEPLIFVLVIYIVIILIYIPVQYKYIESLIEMQKRKKLKQGDLYDDLPVQDQLVHSALQGGILFPANAIAYYLFKRKQKKSTNNV